MSPLTVLVLLGTTAADTCKTTGIFKYLNYVVASATVNVFMYDSASLVTCVMSIDTQLTMLCVCVLCDQL